MATTPWGEGGLLSRQTPGRMAGSGYMGTAEMLIETSRLIAAPADVLRPGRSDVRPRSLCVSAGEMAEHAEHVWCIRPFPMKFEENCMLRRARHDRVRERDQAVGPTRCSRHPRVAAGRFSGCVPAAATPRKDIAGHDSGAFTGDIAPETSLNTNLFCVARRFVKVETGEDHLSQS